MYDIKIMPSPSCAHNKSHIYKWRLSYLLTYYYYYIIDRQIHSEQLIATNINRRARCLENDIIQNEFLHNNILLLY